MTSAEAHSKDIDASIARSEDVDASIAHSKAIDTSLASIAGTQLQTAPAKPHLRPYELLEPHHSTTGIVNAWFKVGFSLRLFCSSGD
jgi:hypothetical protein